MIVASGVTQLYPTITARIKAGEIDALVIFGFLSVLIISYIAIGRETPAILFICIAISLLYEPVLVTWRGQTIGHKIMVFRIIDSVTKMNLSFAKSFSRFILKMVLGVVSLLWAFFDRHEQFFHDNMTRSMAVMCDIRADQLESLETGPISQTAADERLFAMPSVKRRMYSFSFTRSRHSCCSASQSR
jgi:uncharacterized RDD family membrane protein YckC